MKIWIAAILILLVQYAYSQNNDYISTDSSISTGIKLIDGTARDNAQYIRRKDSEIKYFPEQIGEYGFKDGTVYKSKTISVSGQTKKVFLERLEHGKITLYYYTEKGFTTYFLEKDSTVFVELTRDDFRSRIFENTDDFGWKNNQTQLVNYSRNALSKLISMYNTGNNRLLPYRRFGYNASLTRMSLTLPASISEKLNGISFIPSTTASFGVFADLPIYMSNFSFNAGVNFSKSGFYATSKTPQSDIDVVVNIISANVPVLLRYTLPTLIWRPFINAGGIYSYHLKNDNRNFEYEIGRNIVVINEILHKSLVSQGMAGYSVGIGLQRNLNYKKIASMELRYNQLYWIENTIDKSQLELFIGISL